MAKPFQYSLLALLVLAVLSGVLLFINFQVKSVLAAAIDAAAATALFGCFSWSLNKRGHREWAQAVVELAFYAALLTIGLSFLVWHDKSPWLK